MFIKKIAYPVLHVVVEAHAPVVVIPAGGAARLGAGGGHLADGAQHRLLLAVQIRASLAHARTL